MFTCCITSVDLYKSLKNVEKAFKSLESVLKVRPICHQGEAYVCGHIYICILAYLLEKYISFLLNKNGITTQVETILDTVATINVVDIISRDNKILKKSVSLFSANHQQILSIFGITRNQILQEIIGKKLNTY